MKLKLENLLENVEGAGIINVQCCVCKRYRLDSQEYGDNVYSHVNPEPNVAISHTYCPPCAEKVREELRLYKNERIKK